MFVASMGGACVPKMSVKGLYVLIVQLLFCLIIKFMFKKSIVFSIYRVLNCSFDFQVLDHRVVLPSVAVLRSCYPVLSTNFICCAWYHISSCVCATLAGEADC